MILIMVVMLLGLIIAAAVAVVVVVFVVFVVVFVVVVVVVVVVVFCSLFAKHRCVFFRFHTKSLCGIIHIHLQQIEQALDYLLAHDNCSHMPLGFDGEVDHV